MAAVASSLVLLASSGLLLPLSRHPASTLCTLQLMPQQRYSSARYSSCRSSGVITMSENSWDDSFAALQAYKEQWGNADAPLGNELGWWCAAQRRSREKGRLSPERERRLDALGISWSSPSDVDDPLAAHDFEDMCARLEAYIAENGNAQVPKKYQRDPHLGGWVAACRRTRLQLGEARVAALDRIGFEWVSTRK